jgi:hypothetical protein
MPKELTTTQKGRCGELLAQYMLLKHGIESAHLTTDTGIDLVAYPRNDWPKDRPVTIQVKTSSHRGKGKEEKWVAWTLPDDCPANYVCVVDLERNKLWFFTLADFKANAMHAGKGQLNLWWPPPEDDYDNAPRHEKDFLAYEGDKGICKAFGST